MPPPDEKNGVQIDPVDVLMSLLSPLPEGVTLDDDERARDLEVLAAFRESVLAMQAFIPNLAEKAVAAANDTKLEEAIGSRIVLS